MNQQTQLSQAQNTATVIFDEQKGREAFTMANLVFNPQAMQAVNTLANMLADHSGMVPDHFNGKPGDLMGVIMQSGRWGMDPIAVAQSTFVLNGKIGYEAKLMQAVARANGGVDFEPEYYGDWSRIQGNIKKETKKRQNKKTKEWYDAQVDAQGWTAADEQKVGVKLVGTFPDGRVREIDIPLCTCYPRNSTNWIYDPQQQIYYTAVKRWVRRYAPHLGLGIQDYEDLAARQSQQEEREINPIQNTERKEVEKKGTVENIDDLLNDGEQPAPVAQQAAVSDVNDLLNGDEVMSDAGANIPPHDEDGVYAPSVYEQMIDLLNEVNTPEDFEQAKESCTEAVASKKVTDEEAENLGKSLRTLRSSLGIQ